MLHKDNAYAIEDVDGMRRRFFEAYRHDAEMRAVDGFLCFHSAALCEIFMPFNKSVIVISSTRFAVLTSLFS